MPHSASETSQLYRIRTALLGKHFPERRLATRRSDGRTGFNRRLGLPATQAATQQIQGGPQKRRSSELPWYYGKYRIMSSRLADWLSCPEDVRPARQVVQLLWKYPGNVSSLVAHEAAQCVAFRAAATTVLYGPVLAYEVTHHTFRIWSCISLW